MSLMSTKISEVEWPQVLVSCKASTILIDAIHAMRDKKSGNIIIVDDKNVPIGIFTERDYINKIAGQETKFLTKPISEVMTKNPLTMEWSDSIGKALLTMRVGGFRNIVIVDADNKLGAVLTVKDGIDFLVLRFVAE